MNRIYKLKFDRSLQELLVVSELATQSATASNLVTLSETSTQFSQNLTSSSLYDVLFLELVHSLQTFAYSLDSTVDLANVNYILGNSLLLETNADSASANVGFTAISNSKLHFSRKNLLAVSLLVSSLSLASGSFANTITGAHGQVGNVVTGDVTAATSSLVTTITQNTQQAVIDWNSFDINADETVKFVQNAESAVALNRVTNDKITQILGKLTANKTVYIINPNGIVFGKDAHVDVGSLVATTLNVSTNNLYQFNAFENKDLAKVENLGAIKSHGRVDLVGGQVINKGTIEADGSVVLFAGNTAYIQNPNNYVSYKVQAGNKAVNLGTIAGKDVVVLGNKVLNGRPSQKIASTFADVIGSDYANADKASITSNGSIVLYGGSVSTEIANTKEHNNQVKGERNSIVENNGILNATVYTKSQNNPIVKVLGDNVHLGSKSKILAKAQYPVKPTFHSVNTGYLHGGYVYLGGDFRNRGDFKTAKLTVIDSGSIVDTTPYTDADNYKSGNIFVNGDKLILNGLFKYRAKNSEATLATTGKEVTIGSNFHIDSSYKTGTEWLLDTDYFAVVGSDQDFNQYVKNKAITSNVNFTPTDLGINNIFTDASADPTSTTNYITTNRLKDLGMLDTGNGLEFDITKGLVFYNVSEVFDKTASLQILLTDVGDLYQKAVAFKNTKINNKNLDLDIGVDYSLAYYINGRSALDGKFVGNVNFENSNVTAKDVNLSGIYHTTIDHSGFEVEEFEASYLPPYQFKLNDKQKHDNKLDIINSSEIHAHITDSKGLTSPKEANVVLDVNNITVRNSNITADTRVEFNRASDIFTNSSIELINSNVTAQDSILLTSNIPNITVTNTNLTAHSIFVDTNPITHKLDLNGAYNKNVIAPPPNHQAGSIVLNHVHLNTNPKTTTSATSHYDTIGGVVIGKSTKNNIQASNLEVNAPVIEVKGNDTLVDHSNLSSTVGNINFYTNNLSTDHTNINSKTNVMLTSHAHTNYYSLENTNITALPGKVKIASPLTIGRELNISANEIEVNTKYLDLRSSNIDAKKHIKFTNPNLRNTSDLTYVELYGSKLTSPNIDIDMNYSSNFDARGTVINATAGALNITQGLIKDQLNPGVGFGVKGGEPPKLRVDTNPLIDYGFPEVYYVSQINLEDAKLSGNSMNLVLGYAGNFRSYHSSIDVRDSDLTVYANGLIDLDHETTINATRGITFLAQNITPWFKDKDTLHIGKAVLNAANGNIKLTSRGKSRINNSATLNATLGSIILSTEGNSVIDNSTFISHNNTEITANNLTLTANTITAKTGGVNVRALVGNTVKGNHVVANNLINITSYDDSTVDGNSLESATGVNLSTAAGTGTLYFGHNTFNGSKPIKLNADTTNPLVCLYGPDTAYAYDSYHHHGGICLDSGTNAGNGNTNGNGNSNNGNNGNPVTVVTQDIHDDIADNPHNLGLTNGLGNIVRLVSASAIRKEPLDIAGNCRPKFIGLVTKYKIAINDIRYGTEKSLVYKYKLTIEQAEFLFNCYAKNIGYFSNLYTSR